ncbi:PepSY domain-containing protein [Dyella sp. 2HG41-7]|uniref:PepSY domain-containing protein n=1 Tax=Dyella sp. 2HG41-7 TaxID=2883239 RepID=UPI001F20FC71|nr:PepSY domain-containing protein [Dyella sp. 2HG41-7]
MSASHTFLKVSRQIHLYVGVFIAPALLFFALTGGLQVFGLHESSRGSDYKPPAWLAMAAQVHKKQTTVMPMRKPRPAEGDNHAPAANNAAPAQIANPVASQPNKPDESPMPSRHPLPLKIFFGFVSFGLFVSTLIGIYMAYRFSRKRRLITLTLVVGAVLPIVLALI